MRLGNEGGLRNTGRVGIGEALSNAVGVALLCWFAVIVYELVRFREMRSGLGPPVLLFVGAAAALLFFA